MNTYRVYNTLTNDTLAVVKAPSRWDALETMMRHGYSRTYMEAERVIYIEAECVSE